MRSAIRTFLRFCVRIFYRHIEVVGEERVPGGPVIFAVNHPNGLIDPLFLLSFVPRPISFLAKAPLFRYPLIGWFVRKLESIPVYRKQDNTKGTNAETFAKAREVLQRGGTIAIFPEGTTHSDPQLRELKTGAARIALGANLDALSVVPAGIYYTAKQSFRSAAMLVYGEPIHVRPRRSDADEGAEPPAAEVDGLTARIDEGLDAVTLQADSHTALDLAGRAEDIFTAHNETPLAEELEIRRRFLDGYHYLRTHDPERLARLESKVRQFAGELERTNIDVNLLSRNIGIWRVLRMIVWLPLALAGMIVNYLTYRLIGMLARRVSKGEYEMLATMKFIGALLLYPLTWIALAFVIDHYFGWPYAVASLFVLPLLAYVALRFFEDLDGLIGRARALWHPSRARLEMQRREIRDEFLSVAKSMES
ncbi:MAG TPA: lysophospholipid acyltransferase family protein [Thermoanaerobaculia bacterium]|nr:lysophospholipid acyltransferase family protein [Thermoanaerobaculia bacterium]